LSIVPFHQLHTEIEKPLRFNNPFDYQPHPLCLLAADEVRRYVATQPQWALELEAGKMLGVLVCETADGELGFLAAYSGQLGGREDWPWFVPAVFDYLQPDGYFKREEQAITAINRHIAAMEQAADYRSLKEQVQSSTLQAEAEIAAYKTLMQQSKTRRDARRRSAGKLTAEEEAALIGESQYQKAELRRLKARWRDALASTEAQLHPIADAIEAQRRERRERSDQLQQWLFNQFAMVNAQGQRRTLTDIFLPTSQGVPPSGAGECCAPKLLQYAFLHHLKPLCMAEFWHGRSPRMEVRHDGQYYPACQGKCKPILEWMLGGEQEVGLADEKLSDRTSDLSFHGIKIIYDSTSDPSLSPSSSSTEELSFIPPSFWEGKGVGSFLVVSKPSGLLSVPGKSERPSVQSILSARYGEVWMPHRLDMDTSGQMVVALSLPVYHHLQRQFLQRRVEKRYIALLDGVWQGPDAGTIDLPLRPDLDDRPRQMVDPVYGKAAITDYRIISREQGRTLVELTPHTGRTHQLRMHCAHQQGLALPIVGDRLYGRPANRLCLHAAHLAFYHPLTGQRLVFDDDVRFEI